MASWRLPVRGAPERRAHRSSSHDSTTSVRHGGAVRWTTRFNGETAASHDRPARAARDDAGSFYVTGASGPGMMPYDYDFVTIKYAASGELLWRVSYDAENEGASRVGLDGVGNVYVAGGQAALESSGLPARVVLIKYAQAGPTAARADPAAPRLRLEPARPNPFSRTTTLRYVQPEAGPVKLVVFDLAGRRRATLVNEVQSAGWHAGVWDGRDQDGKEVPPAVYLARLECGGEVRIGRIVRVK